MPAPERSCETLSCCARPERGRASSPHVQNHSFLALCQEASQFLQIRRGRAIFVKLGAGAIDERVGLAERFLDSEQSRIGRLLRRGVLARGFSQIFGGLREVEHVVYDLERETD